MELMLLRIPDLVTLRTQVNILQVCIIVTQVYHFTLFFFLNIAPSSSTRFRFPITRAFIIGTPDRIDSRQGWVQFRIFVDDL